MYHFHCMCVACSLDWGSSKRPRFAKLSLAWTKVWHGQQQILKLSKMAIFANMKVAVFAQSSESGSQFFMVLLDTWKGPCGCAISFCLLAYIMSRESFLHFALIDYDVKFQLQRHRMTPLQSWTKGSASISKQPTEESVTFWHLSLHFIKTFWQPSSRLLGEQQLPFEFWPTAKSKVVVKMVRH